MERSEFIKRVADFAKLYKHRGLLIDDFKQDLERTLNAYEKELTKRTCITFAHWLEYQDIGRRNTERLWNDFTKATQQDTGESRK